MIALPHRMIAYRNQTWRWWKKMLGLIKVVLIGIRRYIRPSSFSPCSPLIPPFVSSETLFRDIGHLAWLRIHIYTTETSTNLPGSTSRPINIRIQPPTPNTSRSKSVHAVFSSRSTSSTAYLPTLELLANASFSALTDERRRWRVDE